MEHHEGGEVQVNRLNLYQKMRSKDINERVEAFAAELKTSMDQYLLRRRKETVSIEAIYDIMKTHVNNGAEYFGLRVIPFKEATDDDPRIYLTAETTGGECVGVFYFREGYRLLSVNAEWVKGGTKLDSEEDEQGSGIDADTLSIVPTSKYKVFAYIGMWALVAIAASLLIGLMGYLFLRMNGFL